MAAISRSNVKIWVVDADTAPSTLLSTSGTTTLHPILGEIKSYSQSGGDRDVESDPLFGGYVDKEKPASQVELSLDIVPKLDNTAASYGKLSDRWETMAYTKEVVGGNNIYTMSTGGVASTSYVLPVDKMVVIQASDSTNFKTLAYNNCNITLLENEHNADDNRTYSMTLKFSPTTEAGKSNFMTASVAATALPVWSSLN